MDGEVPTGVKVLSVLYYIGAVLLVLMAIALFIGAGALQTRVPFLAALGPFLIIGGIVLIIFAAIGVFVGWGLWKAKKWARIVAIILAALGALLSIVAMLQGQIVSNIVGLVINLAVGGYLLFSSDVKTAFA